LSQHHHILAAAAAERVELEEVLTKMQQPQVQVELVLSLQ
jgi:hypothetical protein